MDTKKSHTHSKAGYSGHNTEKKPTTTSSAGYSKHSKHEKSGAVSGDSHIGHSDKKKSGSSNSVSYSGHTSKKTSEMSNKDTEKTTTSTAAASSTALRAARSRFVQNYLVVWLDANIDEKREHFQKSLVELRKIVVTLDLFTDVDQCIEYLKRIDGQKIFLITSGSLGKKTVPLIHDVAQLDTIFVFCINKDLHKVWAKEWSKVKGVHGTIKSICKRLIKATRLCDHDAIPMSFVPKQIVAEGAAGPDQKNLDQLPATYMYSVIFKDIILEINDDDKKSMKPLVNFCQQQKVSETELKEFKHKYRDRSAVWWYTKPMFLYGMLNRALRTLDMEGMTKLGFFIRSLHRQLEQLHRQQSANFQTALTVYRGQGMSKEDFQNLFNSKGGLLSFNNFLSTSKKQKVATSFVQDALERNPHIVGVMFIMTIDPSKISTSITPFAMIDEHSALPQEQEILFTMHTVFRIDEITQTPSNSRLWEVQLTITDESDPQLSTLTNRIKEEVSGERWYRMGKLMLKVGHFDQAEELYDELLKGASDDSDRAFIHHQLGGIKDSQGKYPEAAKFYEKSLNVYEQILSPNDPKLATMYNDIGLLYHNMGEYSKALEFYEKANKIYVISLPPAHPDLATSYSNIGQVYNNMGEYSKALEYYEKDVAIKKISLPPTHPDLATSYNNIAGVYSNMVGHFDQAEELYDELLKGASDDSDRAFIHHQLGGIKDSQGKYPEAAKFYEKSLNVYEQILSPNDPKLATMYNDIGLLYHNMGEYSKALEFYEKANKIYVISLPPAHPDLATSYNNIGLVYNNMGEYSKALEYYEKAKQIYEISLPPTHPFLATSYNNIGGVYYSMGEYSKALPLQEKALDIFRKSLPSTHPDIKNVMIGIAATKEKL
ncbi:unnamed protein product [Rotaria socialis]|uniref:NAD(P)(+)--arginine ADP-ribosyltransferase n=3 Tax=Rotaria socialis TaxID=392032 RepID=A0A817KZS5_9BILA|nr:unnamed protein product [Rotaria socialis]